MCKPRAWAQSPLARVEDSTGDPASAGHVETQARLPSLLPSPAAQAVLSQQLLISPWALPGTQGAEPQSPRDTGTAPNHSANESKD